jgi:hypothetical protein
LTNIINHDTLYTSQGDTMIFGIHIGTIILSICAAFNSLFIIYIACVLIIEYFKPKPPPFLGPRFDPLCHRQDEYNTVRRKYPDGWYSVENDDGTISQYCRRTDEYVFKDYPALGKHLERYLRDRHKILY